MKSKAILDKGAFAAAEGTHSNGIQRLSSLVLQLPNNAINPAFLLLSSVMACADSPVLVTGTVVLSAAGVGVVENAGVVVSANKVRGVPSETLLTHSITVKDTSISSCLFSRLVYVEFRLHQGGPGNTDFRGADKPQRQQEAECTEV